MYLRLIFLPNKLITTTIFQLDKLIDLLINQAIYKKLSIHKIYLIKNWFLLLTIAKDASDFFPV